jgi:hypothetical protein
MGKYDRLSLAPILVEDFDTVLGLDRRHDGLLLRQSLRSKTLQYSGARAAARSWKLHVTDHSFKIANDQVNAIGRKRRTAPIITTMNATITQEK